MREERETVPPAKAAEMVVRKPGKVSTPLMTPRWRASSVPTHGVTMPINYVQGNPYKTTLYLCSNRERLSCKNQVKA